MSKKKKKKTTWRIKASIKRISRQTLLMVLTVAITVMITAYIALLIVLKGPSPTVSDMVVSTMWETRRGKAIINALFTDEEITQILAQNSVGTPQQAEVTDADNTEWVIPEDEKDDIQVIDIHGGTYSGKLMIVRDPNRIVLGINSEMGDTAAGYSVLDYVNYYGAVAGINGGGFEDENNQGDGSIPQQVVIKNGEIVYGSDDDYPCLIGFNKEKHLIAGYMTASQALEWGITDAVSFGPPLVADGHAYPQTGSGGGLNPRTVIGQTADGSILLLVIDGRQPDSIGATYQDCTDIMLEYGAITAANLDGGSSSVMVYNREIINSVVSMNGDRSVPTAWLVK
ncbi:MAG: phosphodiester glycosidase family protein [Erysipelotrichaceae bacterium]|nr:phosphodiester glycosidase family protein [Erysipelotrichaceae bacterium]